MKSGIYFFSKLKLLMKESGVLEERINKATDVTEVQDEVQDFIKTKDLLNKFYAAVNNR